MPNGDLVSTVLVAAMAGGLLGAIATVVVKRMNRQVDDADAAQKQASAKQSEVTYLREIIDEVREADHRKSTALDKAIEKIEALEGRVDKLEERERHMLTRAAIHEGWVRAAYTALVSQDPAYPPPPPPLVPQELDEMGD